MAFLDITEEEKEQIKEIVSYARTHILEPDFGDGSHVLVEPDPEFHRLQLPKFDCDFCFYRRKNGDLMRQLEIRVWSTGRQVSPLRIAILGDLFGFKGWKGLGRPIPKNWHYRYQKEVDAFVITDQEEEG